MESTDDVVVSESAAASSSGAVTDESRVVMSDRVQTLAGSIYQELERMIAQYDEGVVKALMPLVVNVLECLDLAYTENQEHEVELELLREDNEQLATQYEREKQLRRISEQRALELEDNADEQQKSAVSKMESLESIVRMFELKQKNTVDHVSRLEEKEETMKKEYCRLHERYNELLRSHMDYMERTKMALGTDRLDQLALLRSSKLPNLAAHTTTTRSSGPVSFGFQSLEALSSSQSLLPSAMTPAGQAELLQDATSALTSEAAASLSHSIRDEMQMAVSVLEREHGRLRGQKSNETECKLRDKHTSDSRQKQARLWGCEMSMEDVTPDHEDTPLVIPSEGIETTSLSTDVPKSTTTTSEHRSDNNLYQELSFIELESSQEPEEQIYSAGSDTFFGVGKEIDNLIRENNELLATKNALNIVKDDLISQVDELTGENEILREEVKSMQAVRSRLQLKIQELEEESKRIREELEKVKREAADEDEVPMAQRKRFTRVEMARVLMERNQYKERYMELQDALKWTEMIRASRNDAALHRKSKQGGVWGFFSSLFSSSDSSSRVATAGDLPFADVQYDAPSGVVTPRADTASVLATKCSPVPGFDAAPTNRRRVLDFSDASLRSEKVQQRLASERKEQYKKVKAHVTRDDGRIQAYGWSLPAKMSESDHVCNVDTDCRINSASVPVPVPVYCRPLIENESGMKVWCAAGVNLTGGYTRDGGSVVGSSVFYLNQQSVRSDCSHLSNLASPSCEISRESPGLNLDDDVELLSQHLQEQQKLKCDSAAPERDLSSLVWICTSTHSASKVTVVDANNPADVLDSFAVCSSHLLCIASVPGASVSDYTVSEEMRRLSVVDSPSDDCTGASACSSRAFMDDDSHFADIRSVACAASEVSLADSLPSYSNTLSSCSDHETDIHPVLRRHCVSIHTGDSCRGGGDDCCGEIRLIDSASAGEIVRDGIDQRDVRGTEGQSTVSGVMPTMWLGSQSGHLYIHSARAVWRRCIDSVKLADSVLCIMHLDGRVFVSLANGTLAIFYRDCDGNWDLSDYHLLDLKQPQFGIRCMVVVQRKLWCGCRNRIHVIEPTSLAVEASFVAHPRRESQVRQMAWIGDGVWVSIRLDSTLRLYHAHTYQHLQDVDIEPYVSKMLACCGVSGTGRLGYSFVRISSLVISCNRMWIGTGNGVIISIPLNMKGACCSEGGGAAEAAGTTVYTDAECSQLSPASFVPFCNISQAQLSFHGYRDSVKFFVSVPGVGGISSGEAARNATSEDKLTSSSLLVMSGGEGYVDFRVDEDAYETASHIIVWQLASTDSPHTDVVDNDNTRSDTSVSPSLPSSEPGAVVSDAG